MATDKVTSQGWFYLQATADVQVQDHKGVLHAVSINPGSAGGTVTIYDSLTEAGTVIAAFTIGTNVQIFGPINIILDAKFETGLYIGYDAQGFDGTVTVTYS